MQELNMQDLVFEDVGEVLVGATKAVVRASTQIIRWTIRTGMAVAVTTVITVAPAVPETRSGADVAAIFPRPAHDLSEADVLPVGSTISQMGAASLALPKGDFVDDLL